VLLLGMAVVIALIGIAAGLLSRRSRTPGLILILLLGAIATVAVITRPNAGTFDVLAPLAALVVSSAVFTALHGWSLASQAQPPDPAAVGVPRRKLLVGSAAVAAGAGIAGAAGQRLAGWGGVETSRAAVGRIVPTVPAPPIPAGADFAADGSPTFITPNRDFYRVDVNLTLPQLRAEDWRLRVHGMVDRELNLDWVDLTSRRLVERAVTMTCVSNEVGGPYISTSNFTGVLLADILQEAGVRRGADQVLTTSVDGWTCGSPTEVLADPGREAMLVIAMNREPLPIEHGFPDDRSWTLRFRVRNQVDHRYGAHHVRSEAGLLGAAGLGAAGTDQDDVPNRQSWRVRGDQPGYTGDGYRVGANQGDREGRDPDRPGRVATRRAVHSGQRGHLADV
jgi:DMSO/TMAO reductase YedYZ molybdopterin-dependent catalytic subunit